MFCSLFFAAAAIAVFAAIGSSRAIGQGRPPGRATTTNKIAPWVVEHTANGQQAEFMVVLADQADLSAAATMRTKTEKGRYVYDTLRNKSQTTQGPILRWLRERGLEHRSFYIVNAVLVKGTREIAEASGCPPGRGAGRGQSARFKITFLNRILWLKRLRGLGYRRRSNQESITRTRRKFGSSDFTGQGIVVASADTGVRWTHNALKPHYRGWDGHNRRPRLQLA